jgi:hypothetical protein
MDTASERLSEVSISPHYWGIHTSLYSSLPPEAVKQLERAIWLKISGLADEARAIFDNELSSLATVPVVAIEHADLELEAGKWGRAWRILNSKLAQLQDANGDLEAPEYRLMALTWAMLGTRHRGDVTSSAIEIERTQDWLAEVPIADYTDIQVRQLSLISPKRGKTTDLTTCLGRLYSPICHRESVHQALLGIQ